MPQKRDLSSETTSDNEPLEQTDEARTFSDSVPVTRRGCLRSAGVAVASAAAIGTMGSASAKELVHASDVSGTTYDVPSGERIRILVGENQYGDYGDLTNALIKAEGKQVEIVSFGSGWEIRNVGIDGQTDGDHPVIDVKTDGGSGTVENVYLGDGGGDGQVGLFVKKEHEGTVTLKNIYVSGFPNNGIYASTPGQSDGGGGTVQIENCYAENNNRANYRIGSDGSYVEDSVAVSTNAPNNADTVNMRGVWVRRGNCDITNTDITTEGTEAIYATGGGTAVYENSDYEVDYPHDFKGDVETSNLGSDPTTSTPSGVPTSASQAANGGGSSSSSSDDESDAPEETTSDESKEDSSAEEQSTEEESSSEEESTEEESRGGEGEASSEANQETEGDAEDESLPNEVTIQSETGDDVHYEFSVDGEVETLSSGDTTSDSTAAGRVHSYQDKYEFSGEFTEFRYSGPCVIDVNGETVYTDSDS